MQWYAYAAYFFGGAFLVNAVPHFVDGVSGRRFQTPFASPPGRQGTEQVVTNGQRALGHAQSGSWIFACVPR